MTPDLLESINFLISLNETRIEQYEWAFYDLYEEQLRQNYDHVIINRQNKTITIRHVEQDNTGKVDLKKQIVTFEQYLEKILRKEFNNSRRIINNFISCTILDNDYTEIITRNLNWLLQELTSFRLASADLLILYPILNSKTNQLIKYITEKKTTLQIDVSEITQTDPVIAIFGFLKGKNEHGQKIMSDSEHSRLIDSIKKMIETESSPNILPFQKIYISNDLLQYCFFVLHQVCCGEAKREFFLIL